MRRARIIGIIGIIIALLVMLYAWSLAARKQAPRGAPPAPVVTTPTKAPVALALATPTATPLLATVAPCPPLPPDLKGRIFFPAGEGDRTILWVINADRSGLKRVFVPPADSGFTWPRASPDGKRLAFVLTQAGVRNLMVINADGSGLTKIQGEDKGSWQQLDWSPDGNWILFQGDQRGVPVEKGGGREAGLYKIKVDGSQVMRLTTPRGTTPWQPSWSPDGRKIAFVQVMSKFMYTMDAAGGEPKLLFQEADHAQEPRWSPDGRQIVYRCQDSLCTVGADGKGRRDLKQADVRSPVYSPDGKYIAFSRDMPDGKPAIWILKAEGGEAVNLTGCVPQLAGLRGTGLMSTISWIP